MSNAAQNWVTKQKTGSPIKKLILMVLADHSDPYGVSYPSKRYLADRTECSRQTIVNNLKWLEEDGFLEVHRLVRWNSSDSSNEYHIKMDAQPPKDYLEIERVKRGVMAKWQLDYERLKSTDGGTSHGPPPLHLTLPPGVHVIEGEGLPDRDQRTLTEPTSEPLLTSVRANALNSDQELEKQKLWNRVSELMAWMSKPETQVRSLFGKWAGAMSNDYQMLNALLDQAIKTNVFDLIPYMERVINPAPMSPGEYFKQQQETASAAFNFLKK